MLEKLTERLRLELSAVSGSSLLLGITLRLELITLGLKLLISELDMGLGLVTIIDSGGF
jgi:hypothetical protein